MAQGDYIRNLSPEQRAEALEKALQARRDKAALKAATKHLLMSNSLDKGFWADLASKHKVRMPSDEEAVDTATVRKYLRKCNVDVEVWNDHYTSASYFVQNHPTWTKYAVAGLILELKEEYSL